MKIAIATEGKETSSNVSAVTGRAPYFLIFENGKMVKTLTNPFRTGGGGAGFGVAKMLNNEKIDMLVAGNFGSNVTEYFKEKNIKVKVSKQKKAEEVLKEIRAQEE